MNEYQSVIHLSKYARYLPEAKRRETWEETVHRYVSFLESRFKNINSQELFDAIYNLEVMPSMRALMSAGPALDRDEVSAYNCAYLPVDNPRAFDEILYILMCGTGVGFSVERQYINKLPEIQTLFESGTIINVADSKIGWASAFRELVALLYVGKLPKWDLSKLRPAGAPLKTFGGRSSGPKPLDNLFLFTCNLFKNAEGRRLNSLEVHDLVCRIADVVVVGGVRRSALMSLSNLTDERMRVAKSGEYPVSRALANNSVAYTEKPDVGIFMREWEALYSSKSGERGIFNRAAAKALSKNIGRDDSYDFGCNPCGEIILRPYGLCNLTEVVLRETDDFDKIVQKVRIATQLGTYQSTFTNFRYLRNVWKKNAEEERLLGVSLTGIMDHPVLKKVSGDAVVWLQKLRKYAWGVNQECAKELGINPSVAITTVKPSGTVSQLVDSASGIHPRYAKHYIRTIRMDNKDPLCDFMKKNNFPNEEDVTSPEHMSVFSFPQKSPEHSLLRNEYTALQQLEHYTFVKNSWCDHNASVTIYVRESEWLEVGAFVYKNFHLLGGVSFLPYDTGIYQQAPYQEIDAETYVSLLEKMPKGVVWEELQEFEDKTSGSQELACTAGACEL
jgi:ribonucleoside-diphosphate reductase alpha chain